MKFDWGRWVVRRPTAQASLLDSTALRTVRAFQRDEEGASTLLSFYVTLMIFLMAGLGVDTMRQEMERTHLQATLDAAVLAGAGAPTGTSAENVADIVEDYFAKNNMSDFLNEIDLEGDDADIQTSLNATRVFASAAMDVDTYLLQMTGVDSLRATGAAEAQVATPKLEVSLVLDVSGSMDGIKLTNLQTAARSFVTTILQQSEPGNSVISIVPFAWGVTPSDEIYNALTVAKTHEYSNCLRFENSDYSTTSIDPDTSYDQQIFTSVYGGFNDLSDGWRSCFNDDNAEILPYSTSEGDLHAHINALTADGNTSAHIGMKWGAALLDDDFQDVVDDLQLAGVVDTTLANIPSVYGEAETLKVIVLMADGKNTSSYYFPATSTYRGTNSDLYQFTWAEIETVFDHAWRYRKNGTIRMSFDEGKCSNSKWTCVYNDVPGEEQSAYLLYHSGYDEYIDVEGVGPEEITYTWEDDQWITSDNLQDFMDDPKYDASLTSMNWEIAWGLMTPDYYYDKIGSGPWNEYIGSGRESGSTKDTRMQAICSASKNEGIVIYTIGYEITADGNAEVQLENCASSLNNYYPTDGEDISAAFNSIASNVKNLRLTQ